MKKLVCLLTVLLVGCTAVEETKTERPVTFNMAIVNTNNINGKVENGVGYSRLSTIIKNKEQRYGNGNVFYFDAGGNFSGSNFADKTRGESVVKVLNAMNLEATTLGKGDFVYGADRIKELEKISNFRIVASNVKYRNGENFVRPYILRNINGQKVAIIGIVSPALYDEMDEKTKTEIKIEEPILVIPKLLDQIKRNNIDFVIALTSMDDSNPNQEWNITEMVRDIPGIDIVISSGENRGNTLERINDTYIVRENKDFESIGITRIDMFADDSQAGRMSYEKIKASDLTTLKVEKVEKMETEDVFYKVEKGNTLYSLAKQYGTTVDEIKRLNPTIEGNNIKVGETYKMLEKKQVEVKEEKVEELKVDKEEFDSIAVEMNDQQSIPQETIEVGKVNVPVDPAIEKLINTLK
ncbi:LysM peptidoglycan-binding domain-containing protein [Fusobacterium sp.]|uniref:LysM peptidoglycan-binding domain-containing protein n=1 Tax=Fusobacterium sp. TaxID=68766 RepID=UPI00263313AC|nr:LysM peptidoglycan-binding domain-containing protein [Fusobacterium sp.]